MSIELVFIAYNRLEYTRLALSSVLADPREEFELTIWDNGSTDGTAEYLREQGRDPRVKEVVLSERNIGQVEALNRVWSRSKADFLGKLDNDCLVTPGWTRLLAAAHRDIARLGVVACWHFFESDFDYERARHKIQRFGEHQILRHPWTCGTGILVKRSAYEGCGPMKDRYTTAYWLQMALKGWINGFYYPLIWQEHMDDPKSRYCTTATEAGLLEAVQQARRQTARFTNPAERLKCREEMVTNLLAGPYDPRQYVGWRRWLRRWRHKAGLSRSR